MYHTAFYHSAYGTNKKRDHRSPDNFSEVIQSKKWWVTIGREYKGLRDKKYNYINLKANMRPIPCVGIFRLSLLESEGTNLVYKDLCYVRSAKKKPDIDSDL